MSNKYQRVRKYLCVVEEKLKEENERKLITCLQMASFALKSKLACYQRKYRE